MISSLMATMTLRLPTRTTSQTTTGVAHPIQMAMAAMIRNMKVRYVEISFFEGMSPLGSRARTVRLKVLRQRRVHAERASS